MKAIEAKIVVLGSEGVGKTSLVTKYVRNMENKNMGPTIGASFFKCKLYVDNVKVKLQVWDTAGQERFKAMTPMYYRNANAAFLVFDITQYRTYTDIKIWVQELQRNIQDAIVLILVGNKLDLDGTRAVSQEEASLYATSIGAIYFETSTIAEQGIQEMFLTTAYELLRISDEGKCRALQRYDSNDSISAYTKNTTVNGYSPNLPYVYTGIPVDKHARANGIGRLERVSYSIDHIAYGSEEKSSCCF